ncbi:MAG: heavy metal translocating P-type ATPase [Christensenellales bacterium]|jgi:heavy metal translocating P-type ATPase
MKDEKFAVTGMSCAACQTAVERGVKKVEGVSDVKVSLLTNTMRVQYDPEKAAQADILRAVENAGYGANPYGERAKAEKPQEESASGGIKARLIASVCLLLPLMYLSMGHMMGLPMPKFLASQGNEVTFALTQFLLSAVIVLINKRFYVSGFKALMHRAPNMDSLVALGSFASMVYGIWELYEIAYYSGHGLYDLAAAAKHDLYFESAAMILTLITVGKLLESRSKDRTADALRALVHLKPDTAQVVRDGEEISIPIAELKVGDICVVRPGGAIPADGTVQEGSAAIDQSALTGESMPFEATVGSTVREGTTNLSGILKIAVERVGEDTTLSEIIRLVEEAGTSKAPIARLADRIAGVFVPIVMAIALIATVAWLILGENVGFALNAGISVLVISCPCALGLATPVAIMAGTGRAAQMGVLFKNAEALEKAHKIDCVVMDKTGTLTKGEIRVTDFVAEDEKTALAVALSLENASEHPLSKALVAFAEEKGAASETVSDFREISGHGVSGTVGGRRALCGNRALLEGIDLAQYGAAAERYASEGKTTVFVATEGQTIGVFAAADTLRDDSKDAIRSLKDMGIRTVLLTGDNALSAKRAGDLLGVDDVIAETLPADKERVIRSYQEKGMTVAMVGDGINDAPALKRADVGLAVASGTDIAVDSADAVLMSGGVSRVAACIRLSRAVMKNIRENLFWAFFYNVLGIPVAACVFYPLIGLKLNPMLGSVAMSLSSLCVVANALRLTRFERAKGDHQITEVKKEMKETMTKGIQIEGMMCMHCVARVKGALEGIQGVQADISLEDKKATVTASPDVTNDMLQKAVEGAGYTVVKID